VKSLKVFVLLLVLLVPIAVAASPQVIYGTDKSIYFTTGTTGTVSTINNYINGNSSIEIWNVCNNGTFQTGAEQDTQRGNTSTEIRTAINGSDMNLSSLKVINNVTILGTLIGDSPLKIAGGIQLLADGIQNCDLKTDENGTTYCGQDATGGGGGSVVTQVVGQPVIVRQLAQYSTNNNTLWLPTNLMLNISRPGTYMVTCDLLFTSQAATTGLAINLSGNFTSSNTNINYEMWSAATTKAVLSATAFGTALTGTGSATAVMAKNTVIADFTATSTGWLHLWMRSEISASMVYLERGSKCELWNMTGLQQVPVTNATGSYPAVRRQTTDRTSIVINKANSTDINFTVENNKKYSLECDLLFTSAAATTGLVVMVNTSATTSDVNMQYEMWSAATTKAPLSATAFGQNLTGTGSGAAVIAKNTLDVDFTTTSAGAIFLNFRSEIAASLATLKRGSVCRLYDVT
jgi:hypothetical protein